MSELAHVFYSPLGKEYCLYFYYLMVLSSISCLILIVSAVHSIAVGKGKTLWQVMAGLIPSLLSYFNARLLYGMCLH